MSVFYLLKETFWGGGGGNTEKICTIMYFVEAPIGSIDAVAIHRMWGIII